MIEKTSNQILGDVIGYVNDNQARPIYSLTKEIKVKLIDWTPVVKRLIRGIPDSEGFQWSIRVGNGIIYAGDNKTPVIIDCECCGLEAEKTVIFVDDQFRDSMLFGGVGVFKRDPNNIPMLPEFYISVDYKEVEKHFTGEEVELWKFMGGRYEYNPRIHKNLKDIVKLYKTGE